MQLAPKDIDPKQEFGDSRWRNFETETVARNIVILQRAINPNAWTPFTIDDYINFCRYRMSLDEINVIRALAGGGRPVSDTSDDLEPGYLSVDNDGRYMVTQQFLQALPAEVIAAAAA